ncbi:hypothetical protein LIA77_08567 [Sarocladium implicatum]|nr:hypothetical protein LIA77_08567 [Sarocladium implicatum]
MAMAVSEACVRFGQAESCDTGLSRYHLTGRPSFKWREYDGSCPVISARDIVFRSGFTLVLYGEPRGPTTRRLPAITPRSLHN